MTRLNLPMRGRTRASSRRRSPSVPRAPTNPMTAPAMNGPEVPALRPRRTRPAIRPLPNNRANLSPSRRRSGKNVDPVRSRSLPQPPGALPRGRAILDPPVRVAGPEHGRTGGAAVRGDLARVPESPPLPDAPGGAEPRSRSARQSRRYSGRRPPEGEPPASSAGGSLFLGKVEGRRGELKIAGGEQPPEGQALPPRARYCLRGVGE